MPQFPWKIMTLANLKVVNLMAYRNLCLTVLLLVKLEINFLIKESTINKDWIEWQINPFKWKSINKWNNVLSNLNFVRNLWKTQKIERNPIKTSCNMKNKI